jgi:hypothetical protein
MLSLTPRFDIDQQVLDQEQLRRRSKQRDAMVKKMDVGARATLTLAKYRNLFRYVVVGEYVKRFQVCSLPIYTLVLPGQVLPACIDVLLVIYLPSTLHFKVLKHYQVRKLLTAFLSELTFVTTAMLATRQHAPVSRLEVQGELDVWSEGAKEIARSNGQIAVSSMQLIKHLGHLQTSLHIANTQMQTALDEKSRLLSTFFTRINELSETLAQKKNEHKELEGVAKALKIEVADQKNAMEMLLKRYEKLTKRSAGNKVYQKVVVKRPETSASVSTRINTLAESTSLPMVPYNPDVMLQKGDVVERAKGVQDWFENRGESLYGKDIPNQEQTPYSGNGLKHLMSADRRNREANETNKRRQQLGNRAPSATLPPRTNQASARRSSQALPKRKGSAPSSAYAPPTTQEGVNSVLFKPTLRERKPEVERARSVSNSF